ncbi:AMP-binding protein [Arthrobacter sp. ISL-28]|uniref:AMP-binding protein n=1 Tax=Arthrobacter sp. ISL-28 TaxID=2819108 RepID=UPI001BE9C1F8|nr:AMP-binding protein [Arthrobacter sp. ISL-28]MBT2523333.1 AMP-binding protein [Arthrobacter sp. ISL-28]
MTGVTAATTATVTAGGSARDTMRSAFDHALSANRERVAVEFGGRTYRYLDLDRWAAAVAAQLRSRGVGPGDTVALYTHNCVEFIVADIAIARLGAVKSPVNYMLPSDSVRYILEASGAKVVITDASLVLEAVALSSSLPLSPTVLQITGGGAPAAGALALEDLPPGRVDPLGYLPLTADAPAALYFTGGTTGKPKGVLHTQRSTVALHTAQMLEGEISQDERMLLMTPMAHAAGLFAQSAILRGATCVITDGFDAETAVDLFIERAITWTFLVPTMIYRVIDALRTRPVRELGVRTIVYGAAPISPSRLEEALELFGPVFVQLYGQTEMPNWGTRLTKADHDLSRPELLTSCGRASIMADLQVVDEHSNPLPEGGTGEICLRSAYVLQEYLNDPAATADKFLGNWIRTGDIGMIEDGYLYLKDRKNDMVISGGMNVYSREVEDVLARHPSVAAVAVIGIPHEDWGEAVHAVVVPRDETIDAAGLLAWCRDLLAAYARPKSIEFVSSLPETAFGKVDKKILREPYWSDRRRGIS